MRLREPAPHDSPPKAHSSGSFTIMDHDRNSSCSAGSCLFGNELVGGTRTALDDLAANFANADAQGPRAYTTQMLVDHPDLDPPTVAADAGLAVSLFHRALFNR